MSLFPRLRELLQRRQGSTANSGRRSSAVTPPRRRLFMEPLEARLLLSTTVFLDFGAGIGMGSTLDTTAGIFRNILGPADTGTNLTDDGLAAGGTLRFAPLAYDFDGNGLTDNDDLTALANAVLPLAQRALEPFDIDVVIGSAVDFAAASTLVAANAGDAGGEFDAYVFVTAVTSDDFDGVDGGAFVSVGNQTGLYGESAGADFNAQAGNDRDEASLTFADEVFADTTGTQGTAAFNAQLAQRLAYTAIHEAFHSFTYIHTPDESGSAPASSADQRLLASGDVIRRGSATRGEPFIVTRYDLEHRGFAVAEPNNYLLAATDPDIGLRDADSSGRPDVAYVTGTGANDLITLTGAGGGIVNVLVNPFNNQARTNSISSESYAIDLATDTDGTILVDASINADEVRVDASIDASLRLRGGEGQDDNVSNTDDDDLLTLQANALSGSYTPGATAGAGAVSYATGAFITFSEFEDIEANGIPIAVGALVLDNASLDEGGTLGLSGTFVNIDTLDLHQIVISWGDGSANTMLSLAAGVRAFAASHVYRDDNPSGTAADAYTISVSVTDSDDGSGTAGANVTVSNVAPSVATIVFSETGIDEGDMVTVTGTFTDPALGVSTESFSGSAAWSDGVFTSLSVNADGTFSTSRTFVDDHPSTGTPFDLFTVDITIEDDDLGSDTVTSGFLTVNNVDPAIQAFASDATFEDKGEEGAPVNITASFTDLGVLDTHTATVDWGDGMVQAVAVAQGVGAGTIAASHAYAVGGIYTVTLTVTDDDTGSHAATTLAVITGVGLNNGILYVIGSASDDSAHIHEVGKDRIRVHASFIPDKHRDYATADVDQIIAYLCQGDDRLTIAGKVTTPAIVHGDRGDDHLHGGGGPTVLIGGRDDDMLIGQSGRDILIGGAGADRVVGGSGDDILIGGRTTFDHNQDAALTTALLIWTDALASYESRAAALDGYLTVIDDLEPDKLTGAAGRDLFYAGAGDTATDLKANESVAALLYSLAGATTSVSPVTLAASGPPPAIDWTGRDANDAMAGGGVGATSWLDDFVTNGGQSEAERKRNAGMVVTLPRTGTAARA